MTQSRRAGSEVSPFTVIIPAHNEEGVIARCLTAFGADRPAGKMQVIVAANGCTDRTVEIARQTAPDALVLDIPEGSKTRAMNAAINQSAYSPLIFLDADVQCTFSSLAALADVLREPGVMAASPALKMDFSRSNWLIRCYYRVWLTQPYVTRAMVGSGCFGLSQAGLSAIGEFPDITGDDIWVHTRFPENQRRNVGRDRHGQPVSFLVSPPRRARDQIRVETRRRLGNAQVKRLYPSPHASPSEGFGSLRAALSGGANPLDILIYLAIKLSVRIRAHRLERQSNTIHWERDVAAREV